jgi:hypothetical protein
MTALTLEELEWCCDKLDAWISETSDPYREETNDKFTRLVAAARAHLTAQANCYECDTPLVGPLCPKCSPPTPNTNGERDAVLRRTEPMGQTDVVDTGVERAQSETVAAPAITEGENPPDDAELDDLLDSHTGAPLPEPIAAGEECICPEDVVQHGFHQDCPIHGYAQPPIAAGGGEFSGEPCICIERGTGPEGCGICNETGKQWVQHSPWLVLQDAGFSQSEIREIRSHLEDAGYKIVAPLPEPIAAGGGEVKGVLGDCICEQNAEDYMRPCPVHAPSESERELAKECLAWCSGVYLNTHDPAEILAKAAAVIDRQVSRQDAYRSVLHQVYDEATYRLKPSWEKVGQWTFAVLRGTKDA